MPTNDYLKHNLQKKITRFTLIFLLVLAVCYFGMRWLTGATVEGGYYNEFLATYFNVTSWLRASILNSTRALFHLFGVATIQVDDYVVKTVTGRGIKLVYGCLAIGIMSFWVAFTAAVPAKWSMKLRWMLGGLLLIWCLNVLRISMVLWANYAHWHFPFGWDHHTWFNIITYIAVLLMVYFFDKQSHFLATDEAG
ncbi:exosortase/archaeosortase family protein [Ferruginibacter yonginensis]|uniref:Exosortase/archaeosortase family protein n=1 Tax=Ferruginibacter yonginensis TaxID=1310416 RepID=A0ABV8QPG2_9BACT